MAQSTKLTYEDYLLIPEDGMRHEIVDGEHVVNAAPVPRHQYVAGKFYLELHRVVEGAGRGAVYFSPIDVELGRHDIVQPDLIAILRDNLSILKPTRVIGSPDLVVEILSPATRHLDRVRKRERYEVAGVPQYWIVDPVEDQLENWLLEDGRLEQVGIERESVCLRSLPDDPLDLRKVWWRELR